MPANVAAAPATPITNVLLRENAKRPVLNLDAEMLESNGLFVFARGTGLPQLIFPGFRDIRGYRAMYRDFLHAIRTGQAPQMNIERALDDQRLMDQIYAAVRTDNGAPRGAIAVGE